MKFLNLGKSIVFEYGVDWAIYRTLYSAKLQLLKHVPKSEVLFEKDILAQKCCLFNIDINSLKLFLTSLPIGEQERIISIANSALDGKIIAFSNELVDYGSPIDWFLNPYTGERAVDKKKWYDISSFSEELGDIKGVWEASRFPHFFYMARAYLITSNEKYAIGFWEQVESWLLQNTYSFGVNWKCGQEAAIRMLSFLLNYAIFRTSPVSTKEKRHLGLDLVTRCYKKIRSNFFYAHKCIKNNHTISELCGWIAGAWCCNDVKSLLRGYRLLEEEIVKQFKPDGGYIQFSFNYQRLALQMIECALVIGEKVNISLSTKVIQRINNSILQLYQLQDEKTGFLPNHGANDGALVFPVTSCNYNDFRPIINSLYAKINGKLLYDRGNYYEELLWFGKKSDFQLPIEIVDKTSSFYSNSGLYSFQHKDGFIMICLRNYKSRPGHFDGMHIDLWHKGKNLLCDSGSYSYADQESKKLAQTTGHNTVQIGNKEQMGIFSKFMVCDWSSCKDVNVTPDRFYGEFYSKNNYKHIREINLSIQGFIIEDTIYTRTENDICNFYFHIPYNCKIINNKVYIIDNKDLVLCQLSIDSYVESIKIVETYSSRYYLSKEKINCLIINKSIKNHSCKLKFEICLL